MNRADLDELLDVEQGLVLVNLWEGEPSADDGLRRAMDEVEERMGDRMRVLRLQVDEVPDLVRRYGVKGTPVCLVFREGRLVARWRGRFDARELARRCAALLEA